MDFNTLKNEIKKVLPTEPVFIYIGVGTFAGLLNQADGTLAPENYHQYPPFVQDLRNRVANLNTFLVLIDPQQENPPYLTRDFPVVEVELNHYKSVSVSVSVSVSENVSQNQSQRLQVLVYRNAVYTDPDVRHYHDERAINITAALQDLNKFAVENRASLLYHDFTGRRTADLAEYFDYDCEAAMDQVVYAMSAREHHGCYFDLSKPDAYFAIKVVHDRCSERPIVKMFNYFKYILNSQYAEAEAERQSYPAYMHPFIEEQKQHIIHDIKTEFKNNYIAALRQIKKIILNPESDVDPNTYLYNHVFNRYQCEMLLELLRTKEYILLEEILFNICAAKLEVLAYLKQMDLTGEQILKFITADPDPYQWYKSMNHFL